VSGRYESQLFLLVMPETSIEDADNLLQQIVQECKDGALKDLADNPLPDLQFGVAEWTKGDDPQRLITRTIESI
jgi:PleD family two-component response regulator